MYTVKNYDGRTLGEAKKAITFYLIAARWESGNGTNDWQVTRLHGMSAGRIGNGCYVCRRRLAAWKCSEMPRCKRMAAGMNPNKRKIRKWHNKYAVHCRISNSFPHKKWRNLRQATPFSTSLYRLISAGAFLRKIWRIVFWREVVVILRWFCPIQNALAFHSG